MERKSIIVHLPIDLTIHKPNSTSVFNTISEKQEEKKNELPTSPLFNSIPNSEKKINEVKSFDFDNVTETCNYNSNWKNLSSSKTKQEYKIISEGIEYDKKTIQIILVKYYNEFKNKIVSYPVHCWHCFHKIQDKPYGIPQKYENETFYLKGFFCSFNCALTYNYNLPESERSIQEKESLIRMLYKMSIKGKSEEKLQKTLQYAPPREALKIFGGHMTIEEFRKNNNYVDIIYEPSVPLVSYLDETNISNDNNDINNSSMISLKGRKNDLYSYL